MNCTHVQLAALLGALAVAGGCQGSDAPDDSSLAQPVTWPQLPASVHLSADQQAISLADQQAGERLFFSGRLSRDGRVSCGTCHLAERAFQDGKALSEGIAGDLLQRNTPSLFNMGWAKYITWSNLALLDLESHMVVPLFGDTPPEMQAQVDPLWLQTSVAADPQLLAQLLEHPDLDSAQDLTWAWVIDRIADYMRTLVSFDAPWDRFVAGDASALSPQARRGADLFFSDRLACASCHPPPFFSTAFRADASTVAVDLAFANTGLYNLVEGEHTFPFDDPGMKEFTGRAEDEGRFRIPSLRNVALTAPYMHDASVGTLEEVLAHYARGGREILSGPLRGDGARNPYKDPRVAGFELSAEDEGALIAFLKSLSGDAASSRALRTLPHG